MRMQTKNQLTKKLKNIWESRAPNERMTITVMSSILLAALYFWLVQSGGQAHTQLRASVTMLRTQVAHLEQQTAELDHLRATPVTPASNTDLRTLVQAQTGAAGLSGEAVKIDVQDANQVTVAFGAVAFADWLHLIAGLKSQQIRLDTCRIEALSTPGMVSVTATLLRAKQL